MKIKIDKEAGAAYIYLVKEPEKLQSTVRSETVSSDLTLDYTPDGKLFGIEILNLDLLDLPNLPE
jgi:uncharacterized protein YuzE